MQETAKEGVSTIGILLQELQVQLLKDCQFGHSGLSAKLTCQKHLLPPSSHNSVHTAAPLYWSLWLIPRTSSYGERHPVSSQDAVLGPEHCHLTSRRKKLTWSKLRLQAIQTHPLHALSTNSAASNILNKICTCPHMGNVAIFQAKPSYIKLIDEYMIRQHCHSLAYKMALKGTGALEGGGMGACSFLQQQNQDAYTICAICWQYVMFHPLPEEFIQNSVFQPWFGKEDLSILKYISHLRLFPQMVLSVEISPTQLKANFS